jgi:hypothetical protein
MNKRAGRKPREEGTPTSEVLTVLYSRGLVLGSGKTYGKPQCLLTIYKSRDVHIWGSASKEWEVCVLDTAKMVPQVRTRTGMSNYILTFAFF